MISRRQALITGMRVSAGLPLLTLGGCGPAKKKPATEEAETPPPDATLTVTAVTSDVINPDDSGIPSPLLIRVYQLAASDGFEAASYRDLFEFDQATLGASLVGRVEFILGPNQTTAFSQSLAPNALFLGFFAGYRNWAKIKWRLTQPLKAVSETALTLTLLRLGMDLTPD